MSSNHWKDADAAEAGGAKSVLINSPWVGNGHHDSVVASLEEAVDKVLTWCEPSAYGVGAVGGVACVA